MSAATNQDPSPSTERGAETPRQHPEQSTPPEQETPPAEEQAEQDVPAEVMPGATPDSLRAEVRRLRDEAATSRIGARRAETLSTRLVEAYAAATRLLADPSDLRVEDPAALLDDDGLPDPAKVTAAVEALIEVKPHLASRTPRGDIDQGARDDAADVDLAAILRAGT